MKKYIIYSLLIISLIIPSFSFAQSAAPTISTISPTTALACDAVTISGTNFSQNSSIIWDGSVAIKPDSWTATSLVFKTPGTLMAGGTYGDHDLFVRNYTNVESNHISLTTYLEPQGSVGGFGGYTTHVMHDVCVTFQEYDNVIAAKMKDMKVNWNTVNPSALTELSKLTRNVNGAMTDQVDALRQKLFLGVNPLSNDEKAYLRLTIGGGGQYYGTYNTSNGTYTYAWRANGYFPLGDPSNDETTWNVNITTLPTAPTLLSVAAINCGASSFNVTWTKQNGATKYNLWRAVGGEVSKFYSDAYIWMTTENGMVGGETYKYKVQAENSFGKSSFSNEVTYVFPVECAKAEAVVFSKFKIGDTIKTTSNINVRSSASGSIVDIQKINSYGTVVSGPETGGGYSWWKIDFQSGIGGWSAENYLVASSIPSTPPTTPPTNPDPNLVPGCTSTTGFSSTTGQPCNQSASNVPGCTSTAGFSTTTGQSCNPSTAFSIPGCTSRSGIMRVTGFSTITGQSCAGNGATSGGTPPSTPPSTPPVTPPSTPPAIGFKIGDTVKVKSEIILNVRATASASGILLGKQNGGVTGKIIDGPTIANGYTWWKIDYSSGVDGWSAENYLIKSTLAPSIPSTPVASSSGLPTSPNTGEMCGSYTSLNAMLDPINNQCLPGYIKGGGTNICFALGPNTSVSTSTPGATAGLTTLRIFGGAGSPGIHAEVPAGTDQITLNLTTDVDAKCNTYLGTPGASDTPGKLHSSSFNRSQAQSVTVPGTNTTKNVVFMGFSCQDMRYSCNSSAGAWFRYAEIVFN